MTLPPPPPAPGATPGLVVTPAPSAPHSSGKTSDRTKPSRLPLILAIVALVIGAALLLFSKENVALSILGYALTGLALPLFVGWDVVSQRNGMKNRNFISSPGQSRVMRILMGVGFLVAMVHIWTLANVWAESLSDAWNLH